MNLINMNWFNKLIISLVTLNAINTCVLAEDVDSHTWPKVKVSQVKTLPDFYQDAYIKASNSSQEDYFGSSVAVYKDTIVVGAAGENSSASGINADPSVGFMVQPGAAYIYRYADDQWIQEAYLKAPVPKINALFGSAVAVSGDTVVVAAQYESSASIGINADDQDTSAYGAGAVYVFVKQNGEWIQQAYIKASNTEEDDEFGSSLALQGDTLVVGAIGEDSNGRGIGAPQNNNGSPRSGAVYVFTRNEGQWSQQAYIKAPNTEDYDWFGSAVALYGDLLAVSSRYEDSSANEVNGNMNSNSLGDSGAVYIYKRTNEEWQHESYIKASNVGANDQFGRSLSLYGQTLVVGAPNEDSKVTGVRPTGSANNLAEDAGAVYVYSRLDGIWAEEAFLKPNFIDAEDLFGYSVSLFGDQILVGALQERGKFSGLNGDQSNNSLEDAGAAYIFLRSSGSWLQTTYIKPSFVDDSNYQREFFGDAVSIHGKRMVIGAPLEDSNADGVNGDESDNSNYWSGAAYSFVLPTVMLSPGYSALWFNPNQSGHGLNIYLLPDERIVGYWYTYDNNGNPLWLTAVGAIKGNTAVMDVFETRGPKMPPFFLADEVESNSWGKIELEFFNCNQGLFSWEPLTDSGYQRGAMPVSRLTSTLGLGCTEF